MKFELVEEANSGNKTKIYSPILLEDKDITLYERFIQENSKTHKREVDNIDERLKLIGNECGLMEEFFDTSQGKFGQNICKFYDRPKSFLRLYFIEYGNAAIILGGGGVKPKNAKAFQEVEKLKEENYLLRDIADTLQMAERAGHFGINEDGTMWSTTNYIYDTDKYAATKKTT